METNQPSRAKAFFDEIKLPENGAKFLNQLICSEIPTFESEFLDFKGNHNLDVKSDDLLKLWAKNLSCFANSEGGVVVFGIDAPKGKAKSLSLVQDVAALHERLKSLIPKITEPPVQRVEIEIYAYPPATSTGFVVCYIPASPWRPHQVRLGGQPDQFYIRAADNCIPCNHSTLRALFAPQFVSKIDLFYKVVIRKPNITNGWRDIFLCCWIINAGPATASELFVLCEVQFNMQGPQFDHRLWEEAVSGRPGHTLLARRSIHPEERLHLFDIQLGTITTLGQKMFTHNYDCFIFKFSISARNQAPTKCEIAVRAQDVEDATDKRATLVSEIPKD